MFAEHGRRKGVDCFTRGHIEKMSRDAQLRSALPMGFEHGDCFGEGLLANIGERQMTATLSKIQSQSPADAATGAGDDGGLSFERNARTHEDAFAKCRWGSTRGEKRVTCTSRK